MPMATTPRLPQTAPRLLNDRQQRFVDEYLKDLNATQAYRRAGYAGNANVCAVEAARLLRNPQIAAALALAQEQRAQRLHVEADAVLHELVLLYASDITHYVIDDQGNVALAPHAPKDAMRAVSSLKKKVTHTAHGPIYETEIKLWNKPAALKMGGEHLGLLGKRDDKGQEISDLLKAVLFEMHERSQARNLTPEADWAPVPPGERPPLPAPPAVDEDDMPAARPPARRTSP